MNCIKCEKHLEDVTPDDNQPYGGTEFTTYGHYGSRVTDLMNGTMHVINVCDDCIEAAKKRGLCFTIQHDTRNMELMGR